MPKYSDKQIADGLKAARGMVYVAARQMGCSPDTIKARMAKSPRLAAIHEAEGEMVLDTAELKLGQAIVNGESWAIKFALSTKGKSRGYVEGAVIEHSGRNGGPIETKETGGHKSTAEEIREVERHIAELERDIALGPGG